MAEKTSFMPSIRGDRKYTVFDWASYFSSFIGNGVYPNPSTNLQVITNNDMSVSAKVGKAFINGYFYVNDTEKIIKIDNADGVLNRIDNIVVRLDMINRLITTEVVKGEFSQKPTPPQLTRNVDIYELKIAEIYIKAGDISILQEDITDTRLNDDVCGLVTQTVKEIDTKTLYKQIQADLEHFRNVEETDFKQWKDNEKTDFEKWKNTEQSDFKQWKDKEKSDYIEWVKTLKDILDEEVAGHLLNLIQDLQKQKANKSNLLSCTLLTSKWQGEKPPYTYKFENAKITATSNQELLPSETITDKELSALQSANLTDIGQGNGYFMLQANGEKPKIDIPIRLIFRGDM